MKISDILPPEFDGRESLVERFQDDPQKAFASFQELNSKFGSLARQARVPEPGAPPEEWKAYYSKIGVPEDISEYTVPESKDPGIVKYLAGLREVAAKAGIPKASFEKLAAAAAAMGDNQVEEQQQTATSRNEAYRAKLKDLYGAKAEEKAAQAQEILEKLTAGDDEFRSLLEKSGATAHPGMTGLMVKIGELVSEDVIAGGLGGSGTTPPADPITLGQRGREIMADPDYTKPRSPRQAVLQAEYMEILAKLDALGIDGVMDPRTKPRDPMSEYFR